MKAGHVGNIIQKNPHIYLLSSGAFENQSPNYQIKKLLDRELDNKRIKFESSYEDEEKPYKFKTKANQSKTSQSNMGDLNIPNLVISKAMNDFMQEQKGLQISLDRAIDANEMHSKNISSMQEMTDNRRSLRAKSQAKLKHKNKAKADSKQKKNKQERKNFWYLDQMQGNPPTAGQETVHSKRKIAVGNDKKDTAAGAQVSSHKSDVKLSQTPHLRHTTNNFYPNVNSKAHTDRNGSENNRFGYKNRVGQDTSEKANFIEKNMRLGRVASINERRFSGAFDHLNLFPTKNYEKERLTRVKTMKRAAVTARGGNRQTTHGFEHLTDRSQPPGKDCVQSLIGKGNLILTFSVNYHHCKQIKMSIISILEDFYLQAF